MTTLNEDKLAPWEDDGMAVVAPRRRGDGPRAGEAPKLPPALMQRVYRAITDRADAAVQAHAERDETLAQQAEMLYRAMTPPPDNRWRGACDIVDPLVLEQFMSLFASVRAATAQRPFWSLRARTPEIEQDVQELNRWFEDVSELDGLDAALYARDYIALRDGMAALHACWEDYGEWIMRPTYVSETGLEADLPDLLPDDEGAYGGEFTKVLVPARQGIKWKVIDRADIYTVPVDCSDPEQAEVVMHRMWMTAHELLRGVEQYGFDPDVVDSLLAAGPTHDAKDTDYAETLNYIAGVDPSARTGGVYEVFMEYGYMPLVRGEDAPVEKRLKPYYGIRFQAVHCPRHNAVLRWGYWPHHRLPYVFTWMLRTPNTMDGESVPSIVGPFQEEATANVRLYYDAANLVLSPMFRVKETSLKEFGYPEAYPGAVLPYRTDPREVEPLPFNLGGLQIGLQTVEHPLSRARQALSGESTIKMDDRVRKATEVQASMQGMSMKFSLILSNLQASMLDVLKVMWMLYRDNGQLPSEYLGLTQAEYSVVPRANTQNSNPVVRLANIQTAMEMVRSSPLYQQALERGDFRPEYHMLLEALSAISMDNISRLIGPEPPPPLPPSADVLAQEALRQGQQPAMMGMPPEAQAALGGGMPPEMTGGQPLEQMALMSLLAGQGQGPEPQQVPEEMVG
jgi:hypothetical protein